MSAKVALVQTSPNQEAIRKSVFQGTDLIDFDTSTPVKTVAIKVNLCYYWDSSTGYTTDPRVVAAIIDYVRARFGKNTSITIAESDATAMRTKHNFSMLGYDRLARTKKVELFNLSEGEIEERKVTVNRRTITFKVPRVLLESDLFINVPKLKILRATTISCALKNVFGCIASPRKVIYHPFLNEAIVGINKILHPHITFVDGLVALGHFPVRLGLIMAGTDSLAVDTTAAKIMGYNPLKIKCLKLAAEEKIGKSRDISVIGERIDKFKKRFPNESSLSLKSWDIQLRLLKLYCKIVGDVIPPILEE